MSGTERSRPARGAAQEVTKRAPASRKISYNSAALHNDQISDFETDRLPRAMYDKEKT